MNVLQAVAALAAFALLGISFYELRRIQGVSKALFVWGAISFGGTGIATVLQVARIQVPENLSSILFASGALAVLFIIPRRGLGGTPTKNKTGLVILSLLFLFGQAFSIGLSSDSWQFPIVMFVGYVPIFILLSRGIAFDEFKAVVFTGIFVIFGAVLICAIFFSENFIGFCRFDKCSIWGVAIGASNSGNAFGLVVSFCGLLAYFFTTGWALKMLASASTFVLVEASSGRTSLISLIVCSVLIALHMALGKNTPLQKLSLVTVLIATCVFALWPFSPESFTFRGALWDYARAKILENPIFGYGSSSWVRPSDLASQFLNYSTHNIWLEAAYTVGLLGLGLFLLLLLSSLYGQRERMVPVQVGLLYWILLTGLTEVPAFISRQYIIPISLVLYICMTALENEKIDTRDKHSEITRATA